MACRYEAVCLAACTLRPTPFLPAFAQCNAGDAVHDGGAAQLLTNLGVHGPLSQVDECLVKVLAGHLLVEASVEQDGATVALGGGLCSSSGLGSDSDSTDSDAEEQPFASRPSAGGVGAELAERLAKLQLALGAPAPHALHAMIVHCIEVRWARAPGQQAARAERSRQGPLGWLLQCNVRLALCLTFGPPGAWPHLL